MIGRTLSGCFRLLDLIGTGGSADVYLARDLRTHALVAVKILAARCAREEGVVRRFRREADLARRLVEPHVVRVREVGEDDGLHYLVLEYVHGSTLAELVRRRGPLPVDEAIDYACQALLALEAAHAAGIVHCDIKPHNLMVDARGRLKVMDFGIAKQSASTTLTQTGRDWGTPQFMAPEQVLGDPVDARTDLYSLGLTLYTILAGRPPFEADAAWVVLDRQVHARPPRLSILRPDAPPELDEILDRALAKSRHHRFPNARALRAALTRVAAGSTAPAGAHVAPAPAVSGLPQSRGSRPDDRLDQPNRRGQARPRPSRRPRQRSALAGCFAGLPRVREAAERRIGRMGTGRRFGAAVAAALVLAGGIFAASARPWEGEATATSPAVNDPTPLVLSVAVERSDAQTPSPAVRPAEGGWAAVADDLDRTWGRDWSAAIARLDAFLADNPDHATAREKLYAALVSAGQTRIQAGDRNGGAPLIARAQALFPSRPEAPAVLLALTPPPTTSGTLLADDFQNAQAGRLPQFSEDPRRFTFTYEAGEYVIRKLDPRGDAIPTAWLSEDVDDSTLAVDARLVGDPTGRVIAVTCRDRKDRSGAYRFVVRPDIGQYSLQNWEGANGRPLAGWAESPAIRRGNETNRLELSCRGATISVKVNSTPIATVEDRTFRAGYGAISAGAPDGSPAEARFDNLTLGG